MSSLQWPLPAGLALTIGRSEGASVTINRPVVSSVHCRLEREASGDCYITDTSSNGTWVSPHSNGTALRLVPKERRRLCVGDVVLLLSPLHRQCRELRFVLNHVEEQLMLSQLPPTKDPLPRKRASEYNNSQSVKRAKLDHPNDVTKAGDDVTKADDDVTKAGDDVTKADDASELEHCPHCLGLFPLHILPVHSEECGGSHDSSGDDSQEECPVCSELFSVGKLWDHTLSCDRREYTLEPFEGSTGTRAPDEGPGGSQEEEHCPHCLQLLPISTLVAHSRTCLRESTEVPDGLEEPIERCMHCFRDFPLSSIVRHSESCLGDMLGSRDRFITFLPSIHDMDPMALSVLTDTQSAAVQYVMERSRVESEAALPDLKRKVVNLGYTEKDLQLTLQWVRREAPIIVHLNLDRVLQFLVKDTHYRNLFETGTGSGSLDKSARASWEDRLFNNLYRSSEPFERVKYGVLNIVGDPRGVSCCSGYGDSFMQLKKVRLRTTFASEDTSHSGVQLSCCEHYGNVLNQYSGPELQAILQVSTRKQPFLRSDVITHYKEVQIHGPLDLTENVDCLVVNERHSADTAMRELLDRFVERNKCNLLWMDPPDRVDYPHFTPSGTPHPLPVLGTPTPSTRTRRRRRRRRHRDDIDTVIL